MTVLGLLLAIALIAGIAAVTLMFHQRPDITSQAGSNLIVICIDSLRADHLGCYGYRRATSPRINDLANEGIVFNQAYANSSYTRESVAVLFSGLLPSSSGSYGWRAKPQEDSPNMAERFSAAGYNTALFSAAVQLMPAAFARGFGQVRHISDSWGTSRNSPKLAEIANEFISSNREKKFMMYLHFLDPHGPYDPPPEFLARFAQSPITQPLDLYTHVRMNTEALQKSGFAPGDPRFEYLLANYDAEIAHTDFAIGLILDMLKKQGLLDNTMIVITADHGEEFLEHHFVEHAWTLFRESTRVPLLFWSRQIVKPRRIATPISQIDILPTLLSLFKVSLTSKDVFDGEILFKSKGNSFFFKPTQKPYIGEMLIQHRFILRAVVKNNWKFITAVKWSDPADRANLLKIDIKAFEDNRQLHIDPWRPYLREELYNLAIDPAELNNMAASQRAKCAELRQLLALYEKGCKEKMVRRSAKAAPSAPASQDELTKLKSVPHANSCAGLDEHGRVYGQNFTGWDKIPSTKHQIPNKFQFPNSNVLNQNHFKHLFFVWVIGSLEFGAYLKFGAWKLVL